MLLINTACSAGIFKVGHSLILHVHNPVPIFLNDHHVMMMVIVPPAFND